MARTPMTPRMFILSALAPLLMGASGTCVPPLTALSKNASAVNPPTPVGGFNTVSQCPSFTTYQQQIDPTAQRLCVTCHAPGGSGASYMQLAAGDSTNNDLAAANFLPMRAHAVPTDGSATVDPANPDGTSPLLARLNGALPHNITLDIGGNDYAVIRGWVTQELQQTCIIDPTTGNVTIGGTGAPPH